VRFKPHGSKRRPEATVTSPAAISLLLSEVNLPGGPFLASSTAQPNEAGRDAGAGDRELLLRAQGGEMSAFEKLVERHRDNVYSLGLRLTLSETEAAEVVQESFLSAYPQLKEFRDEAELGAWVRRSAAKLALMKLRHRTVAQAAKEELKLPEFNERGSLAEYPAIDWSRGADEKMLNAELRRAIEDATDRLPQGHRDVFLFKDVAELTYEEIADIRGDSIPAIKSRLHQARLSLREAIDQFYGQG
jgi:RNA polymerase sigma-70 factor (ECF subfamily)